MPPPPVVLCLFAFGSFRWPPRFSLFFLRFFIWRHVDVHSCLCLHTFAAAAAAGFTVSKSPFRPSPAPSPPRHDHEVGNRVHNKCTKEKKKLVQYIFYVFLSSPCPRRRRRCRNPLFLIWLVTVVAFLLLHFFRPHFFFVFFLFTYSMPLALCIY